MLLKPVVSKAGHLLAVLYDIFHLEENARLPAYLFYHGESSILLYYGSLIEEGGLWGKVFKTLVGIESDPEARDIIAVIESSVRVHGWELIEPKLKALGDKLLETYVNRGDKLKDMLKRVLGVNKLFKEVYTILAYNPLHGLIGSIPLYDDSGSYAVVSLFVNPNTSPEKLLDLALHELMHGILRINGVELDEDEEEELIDVLCPEGYLSRELGLVKEVNIEDSRLKALVEKYFHEKAYMRETLLQYLSRVDSKHYLQ